MSQSRLYRWSISPARVGELAAHYFTHGIVRAKAEEIEAIRQRIDSKHADLLHIAPIDGEIQTVEEFRQAIGGGLATYHGEVDYSQPCESDYPFIRAYDAKEPAWQPLLVRDESRRR